MKSIFKIALSLAFVLCSTFAFAGGDKILGIYKAVEEGKESKVEFYKMADGSYQARIIWLKSPNNDDGTPKLDLKNPDKSKRSTHADRVVLIESVKYDPEKDVWTDGRVYNPTNGKSYKVTVSFDDAKTLRVKGSLLGFSRSVLWTKLN